MSCGVVQSRVDVILNEPLARNTFRIRLATPEIAQRIRPGQFVMLRLASGDDPLLGRPFALYDTILDSTGKPIAIDIVYLVVGKITTALSQLQSAEKVVCWGPLGKGYQPFSPVEHVALVAGGIGQTPFLAYTRELLGERGYGDRQARKTVQRVSLYYGVRTADLAAGVEEFRRAGAEVHLATDDGSLGHHGNVIDLLRRHSQPDRLSGCGPEPMLHALAKLAAEWNVPCDVSLETPMACGLGLCFSCVTKVKTPDGWDYKRVCVDGPVFDADRIVW
ncbi:MAG: dihydroorotate dehydrogenase electron transfer subunit [Gemmataceae bacterium]